MVIFHKVNNFHSHSPTQALKWDHNATRPGKLVLILDFIIKRASVVSLLWRCCRSCLYKPPSSLPVSFCAPPSYDLRAVLRRAMLRLSQIDDESFLSVWEVWPSIFCCLRLILFYCNMKLRQLDVSFVLLRLREVFIRRTVMELSSAPARTRLAPPSRNVFLETLSVTSKSVTHFEVSFF